MNPYPWFKRWEICKFKGMDFSESGMPERRVKRIAHPQNVRAWEDHDLMLQYRSSIDDHTTDDIMREVRAGLRANRARARKKMEKEERERLK